MQTLNSIGKNFARNTTELRKEVGLNLTEMERISGVSRRTLGRIEKARKERRTYNPTLKTLVKLSETCGLTLDDFAKTPF